MTPRRATRLRPPGPRPGGASLASYEADRLGYLLALRDEYGDLVSFDTNTTVVNDAEMAKGLLEDHASFVIPGTFLNRRRTLGAASVVDPARQLLNAGLRPAALGPLEALCRDHVADAFANESRSSFLDPLPVLEGAMSGAIARFYFGDAGTRVRDLVKELLDALSDVFGNPFSLPSYVPTPVNVRVRRAHAALQSEVLPLIHFYCAAKDQSALAVYASRVANAAHAAGHTARRTADLLIGSLLASQRIPAAGAAWTLMHIAGMSPSVVDEVRASNVLLRGVVLESLRLHPPTWLIHRAAAGPVTVGGYAFKRGHNFLVSPYVLHRSSRTFEHAETFRPEPRGHSATSITSPSGGSSAGSANDTSG